MTYRTPDLAAECDALRAEVAALLAIARAANGPTLSLRHSVTATPAVAAALWALAFVRRVPVEGARP